VKFIEDNNNEQQSNFQKIHVPWWWCRWHSNHTRFFLGWPKRQYHCPRPRTWRKTQRSMTEEVFYVRYLRHFMAGNTLMWKRMA